MTAITTRARNALVVISDAYLNNQPLTRFDVGQPGHAVRPMHQKALFDAGLIHLGTAGWPDRLIPTDAGRRIVRDLAIAAGDPDPYPNLTSPQETTMTTVDLIDEYAATAEPAELLALSIPLDDLHPRPDNLRVDDDGSELVHSIVRHGILEPLNVSPRDEGGYWINAGHRRLDGARRAGLLFAPCIVSAIAGDRDVTFTMLIENLQRRDLNAIEEARGFQRLVDLGCNQAEIAEHTGISASVVSRRLKLLQLPAEAIERIVEGDLSLELAEQYARLEPDVAEIAATAHWDAHRVQDAVHKAERKAKIEQLKDLIREAGVRSIPYSKIGKWDDDTHKLQTTGEIEATLEALSDASEPDDVVGLTVVDQTYLTPHIAAVKRQEATDWQIQERARQQERAANPNGPAAGDTTGRAAADEARRRQALRDARVEHYSAWLKGLAGRKWKAADALDLLVAGALLSVAAMEDEATVEALGLTDAKLGWGDRSEAYLAAAKGLTGPMLTKLVVSIATDLLGYDLWDPPAGEMLELAERFGFEQLPDDHPLDTEA